MFAVAFGQTTLPSLVTTLPIGGEARWDLLTVDSIAQRLYVSHGTRTEVIDLKTDKVLSPILNTPRVHGIALVPEFQRGFISCGGDSSVVVFDLKTDSVITRVDVQGKNPDVIIYEPLTKNIFCFNGRSNDASVIDPQTLKVVGHVPLSGKPEFAISDGAGRVYVNLEDKSKVMVFDPKTYKAIAEWPLAPGEEPTGIALDGKNHRLFSACGNQLMAVSNTESGKVIATLPIGKGSDGAAFDPVTHRAFSSNREGTLTVIREESPNKFSVEGNVTTMPSARTVALDESTHRLFLPTKAAGDSVTVAKEGLKLLICKQ
ncbi:MAG TPA: YncE family protein [bacterium]|jgi:YVTN family beta-propeller protein